MKRRDFLSTMSACGLAAVAHGASPTKMPHILLRSSWQTVNIGDIAHTPGVLSLLRTHLPEAQVTLWPSKIDNGVEELLTKEFPRLKIARRGSQDLKRAFTDCDFLLHGSGASIVAERDLVQWFKETGKPYGIYGITFPKKKSSETSARSTDAVARSIEVINKASFVFFRDSKSLELARSLGAECPIMEFGPDGAFACKLRDDQRADNFLSANSLQAGEFMCCIPRLRYTPYWNIKPNVSFDPVKHARNEAMKEHDHVLLREAIVKVLQQTEMKVLICPEDRTQMAVGKEVLYDKLPKSALDRVVWRPDYWLTGEAVSVYTKSAGLFGNEMHSPIMCVGHGIPAVVCRFAEQTSKGFMWQDIGLKDWLFDLDSADDRKKVVETVLSIASDPQAAKQKARQAQKYVERRQQETMAVLANQFA